MREEYLETLEDVDTEPVDKEVERPTLEGTDELADGILDIGSLRLETDGLVVGSLVVVGKFGDWSIVAKVLIALTEPFLKSACKFSPQT